MERKEKCRLTDEEEAEKGAEVKNPNYQVCIHIQFRFKISIESQLPQQITLFERKVKFEFCLSIRTTLMYALEGEKQETNIMKVLERVQEINIMNAQEEEQETSIMHA